MIITHAHIIDQNSVQFCTLETHSVLPTLANSSPSAGKLQTSEVVAANVLLRCIQSPMILVLHVTLVAHYNSIWYAFIL